MTHLSSDQLGFDVLLQTAEADNRARQFERETGHLPDTMAEAIPFYRVLLRQHHAAMLAGNFDEVIALREEAEKLARRLNGGDPGILADDDAPGCTLARKTAAAAGAVPLWGQAGNFPVDCDGMIVRIEIDGIFGIGSRFAFWPGFAAHAVNYDRPFLSTTGYRSFLGIYAEPVAGLTPDEFARKIIQTHVAKELKGKLVMIESRYRDKAA